MQPPLTIDLTVALRWRSVLGWLRNLTFIASGFLLLLALMDWRLIVAPVAVWVAGVFLARASRIAALLLAIGAFGFAGFMEQGYRTALERHQRLSVEADHESIAAGMRNLIDMNRQIAVVGAGLGVVYLGALLVTMRYHRLVPTLRSSLSRRERLKRHVAEWRARLNRRSVPYFGLALLCFLIASWPAISIFLASWLDLSPSIRAALVDLHWWYILTILGGTVTGLWLTSRAKRHAALSVAAARMVDPRPPVLFLRSFGDDMTPFARNTDQWAWMRDRLVSGYWTLEETIERRLAAEGPVTAIGRPGEPLPPAGAAREYVADHEWRERVRTLIGEASVVVIILGETEGLRFEYETVAKLGALGKLLVLLPTRPPEILDAMWQRFADSIGLMPDLGGIDATTILAACFEGASRPVMVRSPRRDDEDPYLLAMQVCLRVMRQHLAGR